MTISLITNYPDIFKVAVAGGPVIDWKWYEVMYGERYMGNPTINAGGYEKRYGKDGFMMLVPAPQDLVTGEPAQSAIATVEIEMFD